MMNQPKQRLAATENRYKGIWVDENLPSDATLFAEQLQFSLNHWQSEGIKVIWLTITEKNAQLIEPAVSVGFSFHHVSHVDGQSLVLTKRLIAGSLIPEFANHTIGVGGIVTNEQGEVLTIVEKHDMKSRPGHFKFPGGSVDRNELLHVAVVREVFEETGIESIFKGIVGFRHYDRGQFHTSNIYFVCHLVAKTTDIVACEVEIGAAKWMTTTDYLTSETVIPFNKSMLKAALAGDYLQRVALDEFLNLALDEYEVYHKVL